jgi:hypothetical protein
MPMAAAEQLVATQPDWLADWQRLEQAVATAALEVGF